MEKQIELTEIKDPIGNFVIDNAVGTKTPNGKYYHYSEVCILLNKFEAALSKAEEPTLAQAHIQPPRTNELRHDATISDSATDTKQDLLNQEGINGAASLMFSKAEDKGGIQDCSLRINGKTMAETLSQQPTNSLDELESFISEYVELSGKPTIRVIDIKMLLSEIKSLKSKYEKYK